MVFRFVVSRPRLVEPLWSGVLALFSSVVVSHVIVFGGVEASGGVGLLGRGVVIGGYFALRCQAASPSGVVSISFLPRRLGDLPLVLT